MNPMRYRQLGRSGLTVSVVGLGCNNFGFVAKMGLDETRAVVDAALEGGVNLLDTSRSYGDSEVLLGEVLKGRRDDVVLATKFASRGLDQNLPAAKASRWYIRRSVEESLRRLQTDRIDLYQLHFPDGVTPFEETLSALDDLVHQGKVLYAGSSNLAAWQVTEAEWVARSRGITRFVSAQNNYSLLERSAEAELIPACEQAGVGLLPYYPLASGLLTGKYRRGRERPSGTRLDGRDIPEERWERVEKLAGFAEERGRSLLDLAFAGLLAQPVVASVIAGATSPEQVRANVAAGEWVLSEEDRAALASI